MKIIFAGGGTGGHLYSGIALAEEFLAISEHSASPTEGEKKEVLFVGTPYGLEKEIVPKNGYRLEFIPVKPLKGKGVLFRLNTLAQIPYAFWKSFLLLKKEKPDLVFGIGGYASGPVTLMAHFMGIKTAIIEQNSMPGITNRILGKFVNRVFICFENARKFFNLKKTVLTGNPVRRGFFNSPQAPLLRREEKAFTLLILGGSQGARSINQAIVRAAPQLANIKIIHQTGKTDFEEVKKSYEEKNISAKVYDFVQNIQELYAQADLIIARSGAGTVTEIQNMGKAAIFIPYPYAADDHQRVNALEMLQAGAARVILDQALSPEKLENEIRYLIDRPEELARMAEASKRLSHPQAAEEILRICREMVLKG